MTACHTLCRERTGSLELPERGGEGRWNGAQVAGLLGLPKWSYRQASTATAWRGKSNPRKRGPSLTSALFLLRCCPWTAPALYLVLQRLEVLPGGDTVFLCLCAQLEPALALRIPFPSLSLVQSSEVAVTSSLIAPLGSLAPLICQLLLLFF